MEAYDVAVVGAGPAGATAARFSALGGARTILLDRRPELGHPVQCGEFLPTPAELKDLFDCDEVIDETFRVPPGTILRETHGMVCIAPSGREYRFPLEGYSVSRRAFDKALALDAEGAGAELRHPCGVTRVRDDVVSLAGGGQIRARVIVGADGPLSTVARSAGFSVEREMFRMVTGTSLGTFSDEIRLYFGQVAPGGYAWVFPRRADANVGLGVTSIPRGRSLGTLLDRFLRREKISGATDRTSWWVPIGPPPPSAVRGRALFAGDSANLVMATNGGGIPTAMISGRDAGVAAARHIRDGRPLSEYDTLWKRHLFQPLARGHRIKHLGDRVVARDRFLSLGMRYIGASGLDSMMRLRWPRRLGGAR
ncbi:MAG: geranylgeranyl reductase family protein [Thermoplasmata archaeon]|nr:geranylgeranyl reductase family protein [Thermoplasmata archaeon]